jgi:hypothetical protein
MTTAKGTRSSRCWPRQASWWRFFFSCIDCGKTCLLHNGRDYRIGEDLKFRTCQLGVLMRYDKIAYALLRAAIVLAALLMAFQPG